MRLKWLLGLLLCLLFCPVLPVQAVWMKGLSLTASDPENGYRYEWDHYGGFYTNVLQGEDTDFAYFSIDETLDYQMLKDGDVYTYTQEDLLLESGSYTLCLFSGESEEEGNCCMFHFQIVSDAYDASMPFAEIDVRESDMTFFYDRGQGMLCFQADGREVLMSNVPYGAVIAAPVYLKPADGVSQTVCRNGEYIGRPEGDIYKEEGFYECVQMVYPEPSDRMTEDYCTIRTVFYFRIVDGKNNCVSVVGAPEGFFLDRVICQGEEREIGKSGYYFMEEEGCYRFCFISENDADLSYVLELTKDTTAPFLDFDQEIRDGTAAAPLFITCNEVPCSYQVTRNGMEYDYVRGEALMLGGYYAVVVSDGYGNSRRYTFMLEAAYKFFSPGMLLLLSSVVGVLLIVLYRSSHNLKVI